MSLSAISAIHSRSAAPTPTQTETSSPSLIDCSLPSLEGSKRAHDQTEFKQPVKWPYRSCIHHEMRGRLRLSRLSEPSALEPYQHTHIFYPVSLPSMASTETRRTPGRVTRQMPFGSKTSSHKTYPMLGS